METYFLHITLYFDNILSNIFDFIACLHYERIPEHGSNNYNSKTCVFDFVSFIITKIKVHKRIPYYPESVELFYK